MDIDIKKILEEHKKWLNGRGSTQAILPNADLRGADLNGADLSCANLRDADLSCADLRGADLSCANLRGADLNGADLSCANLRDADLSCADLRGADLSCANLRDAKIENVLYNEYTCFFAMQCPEEGAYIGYKKAWHNSKPVIVKLLIPEDALRSSATSRKCRASKAEVLDITSIDKKEHFQEVISSYDKNFVYKVGKTVEVENFDRNRWDECSTGIHHFITYGEAVNY